MKKSTILMLVLAVIYVSCKQEASPKPSPNAYLRFGYRPAGAMNSVIRIEEFTNQDSIYVVQLTKELTIQIREENVASEQIKVKQSMDLVFALPVRTKLDSEVYVSRKNVHVQGAMMSADPQAGTYSIGQDFVIPIKITDLVIAHNDTLEIASMGDVITCSYTSSYSGTSIKQSLKIKRE